MINQIRIIFALLCLMFVFSHVNGQDITEESRGRYISRPIVLESDLTSGSEVRIISAVNLSGELIIKASAKEKAVFSYNIVLKASDRATAIDYSGKIKAELSPTPDGLKVLLQAPNPAPWSGTENSGRIEGELSLPEDCGLTIDVAYFDLDIAGPFRSVETRLSFGTVSVEDITEHLDISTSNRDIIVRNVSGDVSLITNYADINIEGMTVPDTPAYIRNENGSIIINESGGTFDIKNNFGRIILDDIRLFSERSRIMGSYSHIKLAIAEIENTGLTIRNNNEDINIMVPEQSSAEFSLKIDGNGEINAEGFELMPSFVDYNRVDFKTGEGESKIRVSVGGKGDINIESY
jgi:hypothetical protein